MTKYRVIAKRCNSQPCINGKTYLYTVDYGEGAKVGEIIEITGDKYYPRYCKDGRMYDYKGTDCGSNASYFLYDEIEEIKENTMLPKDFTIPVCPDTIKIFEELAFNRGFVWVGATNKLDKKNIEYLRQLTFKKNHNGRNVIQNGNSVLDSEVSSVAELIDWLDGKEPPVMIGQYEVKFNDGHIMVGCQKITNEQIAEICTRQGLIK
jgi:hypothetical protein